MNLKNLEEKDKILFPAQEIFSTYSQREVFSNYSPEERLEGLDGKTIEAYLNSMS